MNLENIKVGDKYLFKNKQYQIIDISINEISSANDYVVKLTLEKGKKQIKLNLKEFIKNNNYTFVVPEKNSLKPFKWIFTAILIFFFLWFILSKGIEFIKMP